MITNKFDVEAARRWLRGLPNGQLSRRQDDQLPFFQADAIYPNGILLDTCVYIDQLYGRLPADIEAMLVQRHIYHSSIAIQELSHTIGVLNPDDKRSKGVQDTIQNLIASMPEHRTVAPTIDTLGRAAILNGVICRNLGLKGEDKRKNLQDCTLFMLGYRSGVTILTRNIKDFDYILQLIPAGRVILYR